MWHPDKGEPPSWSGQMQQQQQYDGAQTKTNISLIKKVYLVRKQHEMFDLQAKLLMLHMSVKLSHVTRFLLPNKPLI